MSKAQIFIQVSLGAFPKNEHCCYPAHNNNWKKHLTLFLLVPILLLPGNSGCPGDCPDASAEDGGGRWVQTRPHWCSEGHQGSIWDHRPEEHAGIWGVVQVQGGPINSITHWRSLKKTLKNHFMLSSFVPAVCWPDWVCKAQYWFSEAGQAGGQWVQEADSVPQLWNWCSEEHGEPKTPLLFFQHQPLSSCTLL